MRGAGGARGNGNVTVVALHLAAWNLLYTHKHASGWSAAGVLLCPGPGRPLHVPMA
ncbi:hypothetical protein GCM10020220_077470 [Nonomuraea rubra]